MAKPIKLVSVQPAGIPGVVASVAYAEGRRVTDIAIEDALKAHQRPKLEQYGEALFVVARTAQMVDGRIAFGETHLFVGRGYVVSVRHGASTTYTPVRERCEAAPAAFSEGEAFIL